MKSSKKLIAVLLVVIILASIAIIPASAIDASETNTSMSYIPVIADFFDVESFFSLFELIFSMLGITL